MSGNPKVSIIVPDGIDVQWQTESGVSRQPPRALELTQDTVLEGFDGARWVSLASGTRLRRVNGQYAIDTGTGFHYLTALRTVR